jgi:hypothetical protein
VSPSPGADRGALLRLGRRATDTAPTLLVGLAWSLAWYLPWQGWLEAFPWCRLALALVLFIAPGAWLVRALAPAVGPTWVERAAVGFAIAFAVTAMFGLAARLLHATLPFVAAGLAATGLLALLLGSRQAAGPPVPGRPWWAVEPAAVVGALAALAAGRLALTPLILRDQFTGLAYAAHFQYAPAYGFHNILFEAPPLAPSRYWIAFWTLGQALIADRAGLTPIEYRLYAPPFLAVLSLLAVYPLARSIGLGPGLRWLAVAGQAAAMYFTSHYNQPGTVFFYRIIEDKAPAAFLFTPVALAATITYLEAPRRGAWALLALATTGLLLTHGAMLGIAGLVVGGVAVLDALARRAWRPAAVVLVTLAVLLVVPFVLSRVSRGEHHWPYSIEEALEHDMPTWQRLAIDEQGHFRLKTTMLRSPAWLVLGAATALSTLRLRRDAAARLLVVSCVVLALPFFEPTAALLARGLTVLMLWRFPWLAPFGIAVAYLVARAVRWRGEAVEGGRPRLAGADRWAAMAVSAALVAAAGISWSGIGLRHRGDASLGRLPARWNSLVRTGSGRCDATYADWRALGAALRGERPRPLHLVGDRTVNNLMAAMTGDARLVAFRGERQTRMWLGSGREARRRGRILYRIWSWKTGEADRLAALREARASHLVLCDDPPWVPPLLRPGPPALAETFRSGRLRLYRVHLEATP